MGKFAGHFFAPGIAISAVLALVVSSPLSTLAQQLDPSKDALVTRTMRLIAAEKLAPSDAARILVEIGCKTKKDESASCPESAETYYEKTVYSKLVGLDKLPQNLDSFIAYFGYGGIRAVDLETLDSDVLMPHDKASFDVLRNKVTSASEFAANSNLTLTTFTSGALLSSRFFAPKIVDYNAPPQKKELDPHIAGWRKLIRLKALPHSDAYKKGGAKAAYILFNFFESNADISPFPVKVLKDKLVNQEEIEQQSVNNQVIVVPRTLPNGVDDAILFLDYQPFDKKYAVGYALNAAFDTLNPPKSSKQDYFLPQACAECHGHDYERGRFSTQKDGRKTFPFGKVNYLDTDQWYDMMKSDFPKALASKNDVIFDGGGKDHSTPRYKAAVAVIRVLNEEIKAQNIDAQRPKETQRTTPDRFKIQAVSKWLSLHPHGQGPAAAEKRSIGPKSWTKADAPLVDLLNHYCFRCHSSMFYDVFDKAAVQARKDLIASFVKDQCDDDPLKGCYMPQGRVLAPEDRDNLVKYLTDLK